jgi:hypothetical protein
MRWGFSILVTLVLVGCTSRHSSLPTSAQKLHEDDGAITASLVFDPPVVASEPPLTISRQGRAPAAYAGFEEIISTYYYLRVDDRQLDYNGRSHDRFERRAVTERVGVTHR